MRRWLAGLGRARRDRFLAGGAGRAPGARAGVRAARRRRAADWPATRRRYWIWPVVTAVAHSCMQSSVRLGERPRDLRHDGPQGAGWISLSSRNPVAGFDPVHQVAASCCSRRLRVRRRVGTAARAAGRRRPSADEVEAACGRGRRRGSPPCAHLRDHQAPAPSQTCGRRFRRFPRPDPSTSDRDRPDSRTRTRLEPPRPRPQQTRSDSDAKRTKGKRAAGEWGHELLSVGERRTRKRKDRLWPGHAAGVEQAIQLVGREDVLLEAELADGLAGLDRFLGDGGGRVVADARR